jgi:hypothetical protein
MALDATEVVQTAISKEQTDWQTFPRNIKAMRKQYPKTIESKILSGFPEMGDSP